MTRVNLTPFATLTDNELVLAVCNKSAVTDLELELMNRLEYWMDYADTLLGELGSMVENKFKAEE